MRSTVKESEEFTSSALASKISFTVQVKLKGLMPWEAQVRVKEEPSTTGSCDSGVMKDNGKAGRKRRRKGEKGREPSEETGATCINALIA